MLASVIFGNAESPGRRSRAGNKFRSTSKDYALCPVGYSRDQELCFYSASNIFDRSFSNRVQSHDIEIFNSRADLAARMSPFVSRDWILKNVFDFSEEEIQSIEAQCALDNLVR